MRADLCSFFSVVVIVSCGLGCERVDYIELSPSDIVFKQPNNQVWMEARCMARNGVRAVKARVGWSVADPSVAEVTDKGQLRPKASGDTEVIARYGDVEARAPVRVVYVERIEVEPTSLTLRPGQEAVAVQVKAFGKKGQPIVDRAVTLASQNRAVVQIVGDGAILPLDPGSTTVEVQVDQVKATVQVVVEDEKPKKKD